jgi:hypothetical protein
VSRPGEDVTRGGSEQKGALTPELSVLDEMRRQMVTIAGNSGESLHVLRRLDSTVGLMLGRMGGTPGPAETPRAAVAGRPPDKLAQAVKEAIEHMAPAIEAAIQHQIRRFGLEQGNARRAAAGGG